MLTSDNYSPDDYELPRSPVLRAFRPELRINSGENYISDSDEELDIVSLPNSRTATEQYQAEALNRTRPGYQNSVLDLEITT